MRTTILTLAILVGAASAARADGGTVSGTITVTDADGKPAKDAAIIVYLTGFTEKSTTPADTAAATLTQKDRSFSPDLVAITVGDTVAFPNADAFTHNVFSQSAARKFDLGSFKKGESKSKDFSKVGVVDIYCNIHPEMAATVLVLPNTRHVRTDAKGAYKIEGVPPGSWTVFAYTRRVAKPASKAVKVTAGGTVTIDLALVRGAEPEHLNKYGEKYRSSGGYR